MAVVPESEEPENTPDAPTPPQQSPPPPPTLPVEPASGDEAAPMPVVEPPIPKTPQISLTFLLVTGRRRTMSFEPDTTIGRVKEFVWAGWPSDWQDERPPAPAFLRILYLGKILQDDDTLTKLKLAVHTPSGDASTSTAANATIVHLSIRSYAPQEDDDLKKGRRRRGRSGTDGGSDNGAGTASDSSSAGCCSCIIC